jgi:hypothetical protein
MGSAAAAAAVADLVGAVVAAEALVEVDLQVVVEDTPQVVGAAA